MRKNRPGLLRASSRAAGSLLLLCTGLAGLLGTAQTPAFASAPVPATVNSPVVDLNLVDTGNVINSVSCPTSSFCMEVDGAMKFSTYNGTTWTPPAVTTLTHVLTQISCASSGVCAGVDNSTTTLYEYLTGSGWFKATTAGTGIFSTVSCASATFCMAAGAAGEAYTWVGTGMVWTSAPTGDANPITGLSCYSATFCAAVDGLGMAATYNGTAWSLVTVPVPVHTPTIVPAFSSVSCPDSGYCIAVTNTADTAGSGKDLYYVLSGSPDVWAFADTQDSNTTNTIVSVKCTQSSPTASGAFCMSVDSVGGATGDSEFFNGTSWSKPSPDDPGGIYESLSCMSPTNCFGSDSVGNIAQFNGQAWLGSEPWTNPVDSSASPAINSVSCATGTNFCVGVDPTGKAYINTGTAAWSAAASTNDINPINSVSCATTTFCLEVDNSTAYNTFNGIAWGASTAATPATLSQVSCASATLCWGVGGTGFYEFTGVWATSATVAAVALSSVSCPTSTFCMAVGAVTAGAAEAYTWTSPGTAWTATAATGGVNAFVSVSCNSGTSCVSVDGSGNVFTYSTGVWAAYASNPLDTGGPPSFDSISCATGPQLYCAAVDIQGNAFIDIAGVWTRAEPIDLGTTANLQVSCSSVAYCVAGDSIGDFLILAGSPSSLPSPPTASAAGASGSLNVTWSSPALPLGFGGVPASSATYVISIENVTTPSITDVSAVSSPYTASSLVNGSQYVFCIASVNPVGISPTSCSTPATPTGLPGGVVIVGSTGVCTVGAKPTALTTIPPIPSTLTGNGNASAFADMGPFYLCVTDANGYAVRATSSVTVGFFAFNGGNFASGTVFSGSAYGPPLTSVGGLESVTIAASSDVSSAVYFGASQAGASYTIWANAPGQFTPQCGLGGGGYGCAIVAADVATGSSAIGTPTVVVTPNTAGSTAASYTFTFVANSALNPGTDFILLDASTGAAGTAFPSTAADYVITDFTHASGSGTVFTAPFPYDAGATVAVPISSPIVAGDDIQLQISSVTNPTSPGLADSINVSTTQDAIPQATNKYSIGAGSTMSISSGNNQSTGLSQAFGSVLQVVVENASGVVQPNIPVTFTAPSTGASGFFQASGSNVEVDQTNTSGVAASSIFTANSIGGTYTITATSPGVSTVAFNMTNGSSQAISTIDSAVVATPSTVAANGVTPSIITITLENGSKVPVQGKTITLAASSGSSSIVAVSPVTDSFGHATFQVTDIKAEVVAYTASDGSDSVTINEQATVTFSSAPVVQISPPTLTFGPQSVKTKSTSQSITFDNTGTEALTVFSVQISGPDPTDFGIAGSNCNGTQLAPGQSCSIFVAFSPVGTGVRSASLELFDNSVTSPQIVTATGTGTSGSAPVGSGYWLVTAAGEVDNFGNAGSYGSASNLALARPIVGMAGTSDQHGYWLVASDGGIFAYGDATFYGSMGGQPLAEPIVGMAATPDSLGYWLVASDGGIFAFGDALFYGSMGGKSLNGPVVGMVVTPDGRGYWMVASDGGIFAFGNATFEGSNGSLFSPSPIVSMTPTQDARGYWMLDSSGDVYPIGDAGTFGNIAGHQAAGIAATPDGQGYWIVTPAGQVFTFGDAGFGGDDSSKALSAPVVAMVSIST